MRITKAIVKVLETRFHELLAEPEFAKVNYHKDGKWVSYNMVEYSVAWGTFAAVADKKVKESIDEELGIFTRKHSAKVLDELKAIVDSITAADVVASPQRFRSWFD